MYNFTAVINKTNKAMNTKCTESDVKKVCKLLFGRKPTIVMFKESTFVQSFTIENNDKTESITITFDIDTDRILTNWTNENGTHSGEIIIGSLFNWLLASWIDGLRYFSSRKWDEFYLLREMYAIFDINMNVI